MKRATRPAPRPDAIREEVVTERRQPLRTGFDPALAGKRAECDGGGLVPGTHFAGRQEFTGTLTGEYVDHGEPPWRWYLMTDLSDKPAGFPDDAVWCESESVFLVGERSR